MHGKIHDEPTQLPRQPNTIEFSQSLLAGTRYSVHLGAALYLCVYIVLACYRVPYKYELEWLEGGAVDHVRRILSGQALYGPPSLDFTPFEYTPFYFYLSALVARLTSVGFLPLRLVSFAASLGSLLCIFLTVRQETGSRSASFLAACLLAASFRACGAWFDVARVDSLFLFLILSFIYVTRYYTSPPGSILAGVLLAASFFTKQSVVVVVCPLIVYLLVRRTRYAIVLIAVAGAVTLSTSAYLQYTSGGWYVYYIFTVVENHLFEGGLLSFWLRDILRPVGLACALGAFGVLISFYRGSYERCAFFGSAAAGMLLASWYSRMNMGGYDNALLPAYAGISIHFGLGIHGAFDSIKRVFHDALLAVLLSLYVYAIVGLQFFSMLYNPFRQVPTLDDKHAGDKFVEALSRVNGEVLLLDHGFLPSMAAKRTYAVGAALEDVLQCRDESAERLSREISTSIQRQRFAVIILDGKWQAFQELIDSAYVEKGPVFERDKVFVCVTGVATRPTIAYVRRTRAEISSGPLTSGRSFLVPADGQ